MKSKYDFLVDEHIIADSTLSSFDELKDELTPDTVISVTQYIGGSDAIYSHTECGIPMTFSMRIRKFLGLHYEKKHYKRMWFMESGAYDTTNDISNILLNVVSKDMTVYGKICAVFNNMRSKYIFIPYRITTKTGEDEFFEWSPGEIIEWTEKVRKDYPCTCDCFYPLTMLYHGRVKDLKLGRPKKCNWFNVVEEKISNLENPNNEIPCHTYDPNVLVVRIDNDQLRRAFKVYKNVPD